MKRLIPPAHDRGYIFLVALAFMGIMMLALSPLIGASTLGLRVQRQSVSMTQGLTLAEAGLDRGVNQLNQNSSYTGETYTSLPGGTIVISVATIDSMTKRITSTSYIPNTTHPPGDACRKSDGSHQRLYSILPLRHTGG